MMTLIDSKDIEKEFVKNLIVDLQRIEKMINANKPMQELTVEEMISFNKEQFCFFCGTFFILIKGKLLNGDKVKDHDHITGIV